MAKQIIPGVYTFTRLMAGRVYLIAGQNDLTLIDAGLASAPPKIVQQIASLGYQPADIKRILITHAHPDHVGGLPEMKKLTGAQIIASQVEQPYVQGELPIPRADPDTLSGMSRRMYRPGAILPGTPVDRAVTDGDTIPSALGSLEVIATPGHAPGHIAFWSAEQRILFCGDVIMRLGGLRLPFAAFTPDMDENRRSIARLAELDASIACFGHGTPLTRNASQAIRRFAEKVETA
jgi:glyoxylase-like metal-dependent hydrolase (beta-lactamase superfamily II)